MNIFICIFLSVCLDLKSTNLLKTKWHTSIDDFEAISGYVQSRCFMSRSVAGPQMEKPTFLQNSKSIPTYNSMQFPTEMNTVSCKAPTHFIHDDNMMITAQRRINGITFRIFSFLSQTR